MRIGMSIFNQNAGDWDRFEAQERGDSVPAVPAVSDLEIFREELELAIEADRLGYDSVWTVEHHFTPYTMVTNPLQWLTYLAGVTKNVDLGTMVIVLPWHNPVRVAEDVAMLQAFLGDKRRVIAGVGRGLARREYKGMGLDQNEARGRFDESLQIVRGLLRDGEISFQGEHFQLEDVRLRPQPGRDLSDQLWCAAGSPETLEITAKHNVKPLIIPNTDLETALQGVKHYMSIREEFGFGQTDTKLALWTYVAESEEEARAGAEEYMGNYAVTALRHYELLAGYHSNIKGYERYADLSAGLAGDTAPFKAQFVDGHPWGTPEQVIEQMSTLAEKFGTSEIMCIFKYGGMPLEKAQKSMRLFAEQVLPTLQAREFAPLSLAAV